MDDIFKYGLGAAVPIIEKLSGKSDSEDRIAAVEKDNQAYKKQLSEMQKAQNGQTGMKKGGKVSLASKRRGDGCCIKGKTRA
jgi:hypothetical protein